MKIHVEFHDDARTKARILIVLGWLARHLEMFAREPREGWSIWGAETQKFAIEAA